MLLETLHTKNKIVLLTNNKHKFVLYRATKEEVDLLTDYKINNSNDKCNYLDLLDMCGHIDEVQHTHVKDIIPEYKKHKEEHFNWHGVKSV